MYPKTTEVLKQGISDGLIRYEDIAELKEAGTLKLTQMGYQLYNSYVETIYSTKIPFEIVCNDSLHFKAGLLQINSDSLITLLYQKHVVVAYDNNNGYIYGISILTSKSQITTKDKN